MNALLLAHVGGFALAGAACVLALVLAAPSGDADTRRGLRLFVLSSAGWAVAHVGYLLAPDPALKYAFYEAGLLVGFWTVFPWLYFCSAYAGRSFPRTPVLRRTALGLYLGVALVKVTNPLHHLYFRAEMTSVPFRHLAVQHGMVHWIVMGLSYALAVLGLFLLFELFAQVGQSVRPLVYVSTLFGAPLALNVLGAVTQSLPEMTYEPLGVAAFAIGVSHVYDTEFRSVQLAAEREDPVVVLTDEGLVRDYNRRALEALPALESGDLGARLDEVAPALAAAVASDDDLVAVPGDHGDRYFQVTTTRPGTSQLGRVVTLTEVTERESYRQELERQNDRLEQFASLVSHDLRNPLNVAQGHLDLARAERDHESLETVSESLDRMEALITDLLTLARQGQDIDEREPVRLSDLATEAWGHVEQDEATLDVTGDLEFAGDPARLLQLFENLFRNAIEHGGEDVNLTVGPTSGGRGFYVADDGPGIDPSRREEVFEFGVTSEDGGTGFGLAIVAEIVRAHGWEVRVTEAAAGGARFEVTGVGAA
jgi:signal transduction histidine kinase